jgi:DNA repair protein RadA/Sms
MAKATSQYVCGNCGFVSTKWHGRCPQCGEWESMAETAIARPPSGGSGGAMSALSRGRRPALVKPTPIGEVSSGGHARMQVPIAEFNRVVGGGLVPGSLVLIGGDPGVGKCLSGTERVLDPATGSFLPITAWENERRPVLSLDEATHWLAPRDVVAFHDQGVRPIVEMTTRLGRTLRCTPSHPVFTPEGWRAVGELQPGARIASPRALPFFGSEPLDEDIVKLIAYVLSDGSAQSAISITSALPEVEADLLGIAARFGMTLRIYEKKRNRAKQFRFVLPPGERHQARRIVVAALERVHGDTGISWQGWARKAGVNPARFWTWRYGSASPSAAELQRLADAAGVPLAALAPEARDRAEQTTVLARALETLGLRYSTAQTKAIPERVFRLPRPQLALFLKVLFSCDGSVHINQGGGPALSYSTISKRLAQDVQHLLLRFGFVAKLRTKPMVVNGAPYSAYELQMLGVAEVQRFLAEIGIWGRHEAKARIAALPLPTFTSTHYDTVPTGPLFWQQLREVTGNISFRAVSEKAGITIRNRRHERPLTRKVVAALATAYPSPYLTALADGDLYWDEIERVVPAGEERVYDLTVPSTANFVANDLVVHNSTLITDVAAKLASREGGSLYVSAEESAQQLKMRVDRLKLPTAGLSVLSETNLDLVLDAAEENPPGLLIVDSIQTVYLEDITSAAGSVSQVRGCTERLMRWAKPAQVPVLIVGHVTKEGAIAGPRVLEHMVDAVLYLEGDRFGQYRILRAVKNRFGSTNEVGIFEMRDSGMREVANPSEAFLQERAESASGSTVAVTLEGTRPLLVEVQALTSVTQNPMPRRAANGVDANRLQLLSAVLGKRVGLPLGGQDLFVNIVGGLKVDEPAVDLAVVGAIASSFRDIPIDPNTVMIGEVGLSGELRSVGDLPRRLNEAARLGFSRAIVPAYRRDHLPKIDGLAIRTARTVGEAIGHALGSEKSEVRSQKRTGD